MTLLRTEALDVIIGEQRVCRELNLAVARNEIWGMLGGNGVGKTTLLHTLAGLRPPAAGRVLLHDTELACLPRRRAAQSIGVLFQDDPDPFPTTVLDAALIGRHPHAKPWQWESARDRQLALEALGDTGIASLAARPLATLSGGERRRVGIATLLTQAPQLYLLDEPTNHLDLRHQIRMLELVSERARRTGAAVLMILHDINLAVRFCDHLLLLFGDGDHQIGARDEAVDARTLERLYRHPIRIVAQGTDRAYLPA